MRVRVLVLLLALVPPMVVEGARSRPAPAQGEAARGAEVQRELSRTRDLRRLRVSVEGGTVTLSGEVASAWLRDEAVRRARSIEGVESVVSALTIPPVRESLVAQQVGRTLGEHPQLGVFDYVIGGIQDGVVVLGGSVTPTGRKASDVADAVARIRGVQGVDNRIVTLPPSMEDDRIRAELASRLRSNLHLQPLAIGRPAFHIVVHNGVVALHGFVPGEIEYRQFEMIARETTGVLRVHNHLERSARHR